MLYYLNLLLEVLIRIWLVCHWKGLAPSSGGTATQGWRKKGRRRVGGLVAGRPVKDSSSAHRGRHPITRAKEKLFQATILSIQSWGENQDRQQLSSINAARKYASVSQLFQKQTFSTFVKALCQTKLDKQQQQQRSITAGTSLSSCCWRWAGFGFVRTWVGFGRALITQHLYQPPLFGPTTPALLAASPAPLHHCYRHHRIHHSPKLSKVPSICWRRLAEEVQTILSSYFTFTDLQVHSETGLTNS